MPLISTTGAASSRGFGQFAKLASAPYNFLTLTSDGSINAKSQLTTGGTQVLLKSGSIAQTLPPSFVVADGTTFLAPGNYYSLNNGSTWTEYWNPTGIAGSAAGAGLNNAGAYKSTSIKTVASLRTNPNYGDGAEGGFSWVRSNGTSGVASFSLGSGPVATAVCYSPALNAFFVITNYGNLRSFDGSNFTLLGTINTGGPGSYKFGISDDGYPLFANYTGSPNVFNLRKILSADLSSISTLGTINDTASAFTWQSGIQRNSFSGEYMKVAGNSTSTTTRVGFSSNGYNWTNWTLPNTPGFNYTIKGDVLAVSALEIWVTLLAWSNDVGGVISVVYRATDGNSFVYYDSSYIDATKNLA